MTSTFETEAALLAAFNAAGFKRVPGENNQLRKNDQQVVHYANIGNNGGCWTWFYL